MAQTIAPAAAAAPAVAELDSASLDRLRELDPRGSNHLLQRVFAAFETSLIRLLPQLDAARRANDAAGVHLVAHTLKSSSASIGALVLSRLSAEVEQLAREQRLADANEKIEAMLQETDAVRRALRQVPDTFA
jgi:HPt (histidine-containing phosphotransfer) domain-containing protein